MTHQDVANSLKSKAHPDQAPLYARFFKAGPGEYGEGDVFLAVKVPDQRTIAKDYKALSLPEVSKLLKSPIHEHRLTALFILLLQFKKASHQEKVAIARFYLDHKVHINNWDLVDSSAGYILGPVLPDLEPNLLDTLARSESLWDRRIAMLATQHGINKGDPGDALRIAKILLNDNHDLIHKAVGWMLREVGKRCDRKLLVSFLTDDNRYKTMPRTMLRYSIEHFPESERKKFLSGAF